MERLQDALKTELALLTGRTPLEPHRDDARVFEALTVALVQSAPVSVAGNIIIALVISSSVLEVAPLNWGRAWLAAIFGVSLLRAWASRRWQQDLRKKSELLSVCRRAVLFSTCTGLVWGALPFVLTWDPTNPAHAFATFVLTGMPAGAVGLQSFILTAGFMYIAPLLLLATLSLIIAPTGPHTILVCLIVLFTFFLLRVLAALHGALRDSYLLHIRTDHLAAELSRSNNSLTQINAELDVALREAQLASAAKTEFLAKMSHEIRTPMNAIMGMTDLATDLARDANQRECLTAVQDSARSLLGIINDVLDLSKIEAGALEVVPRNFDLHAEISRLARLFSPLAQQKQLTLRTEIDDAVPRWVIGDDLRISQIVSNFLSNAIKFTPIGGQVTLSVTSCLEASTVRGQFTVSVADTGIGIPREMHRRIFEAFQQGDGSVTRKYGGTGLGLTIAANLAALMAGYIDLESEPGRGSTFRLRLPLMIGQPSLEDESEGMPKAKAPLRTASQLSILIAEDNPVNQKLVERLLQRDGHRTVIVQNGAEAVERLRAERFDVVLMDCQMPILDGYAAARSIRSLNDERLAKVPIVALTAHAMQGDRERCLAAGMDSYLTKPIEVAKLRSVLDEISRRLLDRI